MAKSFQLPLSIPELCPSSPTMLRKYDQYSGYLKQDYPEEETNEEKISRAIRVVTKKTVSESIIPRIIKNKKMSADSYEQMEHRRELQSLKKRISQCKNWEQRKKDHNDPIAHPIYLMRNSSDPKENVIGYYKKVMGENKRKKIQKLIQKDKTYENTKSNLNSMKQTPSNNKKSVSTFYSSKNKKIHRFHQSEPINLPKCTVESVLNHLYEVHCFRENDLKILKLRMEHYYGKEKTTNVWNRLVKILQ